MATANTLDLAWMARHIQTNLDDIAKYQAELHEITMTMVADELMNGSNPVVNLSFDTTL